MNLLIATLLIVFGATVILAQQAPAEGEEIPPAAKPPAMMPNGVYWYGMYAADGEAQGYARITAAGQEDGGTRFDWVLRIAYEGGKYEEERALVLNRNGEMTRAQISSSGQSRVTERDGKEFVYKHFDEDKRIEAESDAISAGMGFVLAASVEQRDGAILERHEYDEANAFKDLGKVILVVEGNETLKLPEGEVEAWKVILKRGEGKHRPIWVNAKREIVQVDWGSGTLMKLHREETTRLYQPPEPTLKQLSPDDKTKLHLEGDFPGFTAEEMWKHWTTPEGMKAWWAPESEMEGKVGGKYELRWPNPAGEEGYRWQLLGKVTHWEENRKLGFTWRWDTGPEDHILYVVVDIEAAEGGVKLTITHSEYDESKESQANRQSLHEGWEWFCTRLAKLKE